MWDGEVRQKRKMKMTMDSKRVEGRWGRRDVSMIGGEAEGENGNEVDGDGM